MQTAIDRSRRRWLLGGALALTLPWSIQASAKTAPERWAAAWQNGSDYRIGLLRQDATAWQIDDQLPIPTRAHGLQVLPDGSLIAVARRPGDWLIRWHPLTTRNNPAQPSPCWAEPHRQFNGHAILHPDGRHLLTTETNTETETGLVVLRNLATLEPVAEWPTLGRDPHQLLLSPDGKRLWVANGGIASRPETGRSRVLSEPMDSSVIELDPHSGALRQRWQLSDNWLSLRHLAFHVGSGTLGIALQAEHADPAERQAAPVLGLVQPYAKQATLRTAIAEAPMLGYGGDICATATGFAVSSPRASRVASWHADGRWHASAQLPGVCALASVGQRAQRSFVAAGRDLGSEFHALHGGLQAQSWPMLVTLDNHWVRWQR